MNEYNQNSNLTSKSSFYTNLIIFLLPIFICIDIKLIGHLFLTECLFAVLLPILITIKRNNLFSYLRPFLFFALLWLFAQVLTDLFRHTEFNDWTRGWAKITFFMLDLFIIFKLLNFKENRFLLFFLGLAVGQFCKFIFFPNDFSVGEPWKFGYGVPLTSLVILLANFCYTKQRPFLMYLLLAGISLLNISLGFRSLGLIIIATMIFLLFSTTNKKKVSTSHRFQIVYKYLGIFSLFFLAFLFYSFVVSSYYLGENAQEKFSVQSSGDYGLLLGGRTEFFASSQAVIDSPIIGYGSWAKNAYYASLMSYEIDLRGYYKNYSIYEKEEIPTHSYLMGAWVEAGILGAIFWFFIIKKLVNALNKTLFSENPLKVLIFFSLINMMWAILFSPFGAEVRVICAYNICIIIYVHYNKKIVKL